MKTFKTELYSREQHRVLGLLLRGYMLEADDVSPLHSSCVKWKVPSPKRGWRVPMPVRISTFYSLLRRRWVKRHGAYLYVLSPAGQHQVEEAKPTHRTNYATVYRNGLMEIASGDCCGRRDCHFGSPVCDAMLARTVLGERTCRKEGWLE